MSSEPESKYDGVFKARRGRPPGSANKRKLIARDIAEQLGINPLVTLLRASVNRRLPWPIRIDAAKAAAPYLYPRLSTTHIEANVKTDNEFRLRIQAIMQNPTLSDAAEQLAFALTAAPEPARPADPYAINPEYIKLD